MSAASAGPPPSPPSLPPSLPPSPSPDERELAERARQLRMTLADKRIAPLRGRHVAIASAVDDPPSGRLFERAAAALGARVSRIGADALSLAPQRQETAARILGSLYDAIDFIPMTPEQADAFQRAAGVPVFADLGGDASPLRALLQETTDPAAREAELVGLIEAVLLQALG